jgi:hypothetical protein
MMTFDCIENLRQLQTLLRVLPAKAYTHASPLLSGATIGEHTRHVIEFYQCLLSQIQSAAEVSTAQFEVMPDRYQGQRQSIAGTEVPAVNYDLRRRSYELEQSSEAAVEFISGLCAILHELGDSDLPLQLEGWYGSKEAATNQVSNSSEQNTLEICSFPSTSGSCNTHEDNSIGLENTFDDTSKKFSRTSISSSLQRELLYNLEHSIHHQALIRAGLIELNLQHLLSVDFGVAPSTLRARMAK